MEMRIKRIPDEVHKRLKIQAVVQDVSLNDLIVRILREAAERNQVDQPAQGR
jgi:predicted HicB family RNase H-like nuclease